MALEARPLGMMRTEREAGFHLIGVEPLLVWILLLGVFGVFMPPEAYFGADDGLTSDSSILSSTLLTSTLLGFIILAASMHQRAAMKIAGYAGIIWVLMALSFISAGWSALPGIVIRRSGTMVISTGFALYLCARYDLRGLVALLTARVQMVIILGSFLITVLAPGLSHSTYENYGDAWRGAMSDKNALGEVAALGTITSAYSFAVAANSRWLAGFALAGSVSLLVLAQSATAIAETTMCGLLTVLFLVLRRRGAEWRMTAFLFALAAVGAGALIVIDPEVVFSALDRSTDITGRNELWYEVLLAIAQRPWLGYGFGAFWSDQNPIVLDIWQKIQWQSPHAHNGWLDVTLQLGLVGCAVLGVMWVVAFARAIKLSLNTSFQGPLYCLVMLFCLFINNLTENTIPRPLHFAWLMFIICYVNLARWNAMERAARRQETTGAPLMGTLVVNPRPDMVHQDLANQGFGRANR